MSSPSSSTPLSTPGRVVVVGSLNLDLVVGLERMPAPGETVMGETLERHAGGKGLNQAVAAARLGARVSMIGAVGNDDAGAWLRGIVEGEGIEAAAVVTAEGSSGTALIEVDASGMNRIVVIPGANATLTAEHVVETIQSMDDVAIVLTQGEVPLDAITAAMTAGRACGARTILNPAPVRDYPESLLGLVDFLVPNEHEAAHLSGLPTASLVDANEAAQYFTGKGVPHAIITRGSRGAVWMSPSGSGSVAAYSVSTPSQPVTPSAEALPQRLPRASHSLKPSAGPALRAPSPRRSPGPFRHFRPAPTSSGSSPTNRPTTPARARGLSPRSAAGS